MKNYKLTYMYLLSICIFLLIACEKMIEVDEPINQITKEQVFADVNTANAALDNLYMEMQANSMLSGGNKGLGALLGTYADDLDAYFQPSSIDNLNIYFNQVVASNSVILSVWNNAYKEIYTANAIIEGLDASDNITEKDRRRIKGEALAIRTIVYFQLQRIYGSVPYTTTTDYEINRKLPKVPSSELLIKLQSDIALAVGLLEDAYRNSERIYFNKKAAQLVQANIFLEAEKWGDAELVCKEIISNPLYAIQQDVSKVFKKSSSNILWQLKPLNANQSVLETGIFYFSAAPPPAYALSQNLVSSFENTDKRKANWITAIHGSGNTFFRNSKYKNNLTNPDEYSVIIRVEEVYFVLSEALAKQNRMLEAAPFVNAIRNRSDVSGIAGTLTKEAFLEELLKEKRREFFAEQGLRFFDLKRNNQLQSLSTVKPNWQQYFKVWPIPQNELILNPNLNPQNDGY
ncbi:RagB/SusD family nutrient uptake outer membrane protein [Chryseobacterium sp. GP-SGM7]|uniref:RagB/SusD family nutrient uptake outer membrane protein n=1 Tax=Chryseobacterium sp. GP-SGM7 TaxID=3411323 RepID=UPI003B9298DF